MRLVYYTLVDNHMYINMSEIEDIAGMEFDELLQQVHLSELDVRCVVVLRINERLDMSEEMLGVISDPADDTLCTPGMQWDICVKNCVPFVDAPT